MKIREVQPFDGSRANSQLPPFDRQNLMRDHGLSSGRGDPDMQEGMCSLILQSDSRILRVARETDQMLEVLCKRAHPEIDCIDSTPERLRFHVTDLLEGYQYELSDHELFRRLTFHLTDAKLTVDVDVRANIPDLAEDVAKLAKNRKILDSVPMMSWVSQHVPAPIAPTAAGCIPEKALYEHSC